MSASMAPAAGTKAHIATSTTLIPSSGPIYPAFIIHYLDVSNEIVNNYQERCCESQRWERRKRMVAQTTAKRIPVPARLDDALDPAWLQGVLAPISGGARVASVECTEVLRTVATKVRFAVAFAGHEGGPQAFCLKGLLDADEATARGGPTCVK